jgi:hypothetical protein
MQAQQETLDLPVPTRAESPSSRRRSAAVADFLYGEPFLHLSTYAPAALRKREGSEIDSLIVDPSPLSFAENRTTSAALVASFVSTVSGALFPCIQAASRADLSHVHFINFPRQVSLSTASSELFLLSPTLDRSTDDRSTYRSRLHVKRYSSVLDCARRTFHEEGIRGFFRGGASISPPSAPSPSTDPLFRSHHPPRNHHPRPHRLFLHLHPNKKRTRAETDT